MLTVPDDLEDAPFDVSNFDGKIPDGADGLLRAGKHSMMHAAWDHNGTIWFADGQFHEEVWRYQAHVATLSADTLPELIENVNDEFGSA